MKLVNTIAGFIACTICYALALVVAVVVFTVGLWGMVHISQATLQFLNGLTS